MPAFGASPSVCRLRPAFAPAVPLTWGARDVGRLPATPFVAGVDGRDVVHFVRDAVFSTSQSPSLVQWARCLDRTAVRGSVEDPQRGDALFGTHAYDSSSGAISPGDLLYPWVSCFGAYPLGGRLQGC